LLWTIWRKSRSDKGFEDYPLPVEMTIKAANISLYYEIDDKPYLINLIDTPP